TLHHRALLGEVQRDDRDLVQIDVLPDVQLGPVRDREHAQAFALALARVVQTPEFGALQLRVPAMLFRTDREDALFRARFFFVAPGAAERRIEAVVVERLLQALGLPDVGVYRRAVRKRIDVFLESLGVPVYQQFELESFGGLVVKR